MACGPSAGRADLVGLVRHVPPWAFVRSSTNASILLSHHHWLWSLPRRRSASSSSASLRFAGDPP